MKYQSISRLDKPVSRLVLGCSGAKFRSGEAVDELMEAALDCGINCFDTAREYGGSEAAIGRWLARSGRREELVLISKCCHPTLAFVQRVNPRAAEADLARSLETLGTDHIDLYLLHRDSRFAPVERIIETMNRFREEGKIRAFGASNWTAERIAAANAWAESRGLEGFTVSSPHYSLGRQIRDPWGNGCLSVTGEKNAPQRQWYREKGMPLFCWSALSAGVFSGRIKSEGWGELRRTLGFNANRAYNCPDNRERLRRCEVLAREKGASVAQLALAWLLGAEEMTFPILSASSPARLRENAAAAELDLTPEERAYLNLERETPA